jgi:hypothetical protein
MNRPGAQYTEEQKAIIKHVAAARWGKKYIDIGAFHPVELSNTYMLYKMGWDGDVYEPQNYEKLYAKIRSRDIYHKCVVTNHTGKVTLFIDKRKGREGRCTTVESKWKNRLNYNWGELEVNAVDAVSLEGVYSFGSIDAEGHEGVIINRLNFSKLKIGILMVESLEHKTAKKTHTEWEPSLLDNGYSFLAQYTALNRFYIHMEWRK